MKKSYNTPEAEVVLFEKKDVLTASATEETTTTAEGENAYENLSSFL